MLVLLILLMPFPPPPPPTPPGDVELLARLLAAETNGVEPVEVRIDMALSVLDTVAWRVEHGVLSDGTLEGTLGWHSPSGVWQFPPCVLLGDDWSPRDTCRPDADLDFYRAVVWAYEGGARGSCRSYPNYHSLAGKPGQCWIVAANGSMAFYDGRWNAPDPAGWDAREVLN